jgi:type III restriction enzyme
MKLHFEPNLDYQLQAIESVCDLFRGQETCRTEFTVTMKLPDQQLTLGVADTDKGLGNRLTLLDDQLLDNLRSVQLRNGLRRPARWHRATSRWRWRPAPARPTSTCARSSS